MKIEDFSDEEILQEFLNRYLKNDLDDDFFVDEVFDRGLEYKFETEYSDYELLDKLLDEIENRDIKIPFSMTESYAGRNIEEIVESIYQNDYNTIREKDIRDLLYLVLGKII
jgi:rubrerythrin